MVGTVGTARGGEPSIQNFAIEAVDENVKLGLGAIGQLILAAAFDEMHLARESGTGFFDDSLVFAEGGSHRPCWKGDAHDAGRAENPLLLRGEAFDFELNHLCEAVGNFGFHLFESDCGFPVRGSTIFFAEQEAAGDEMLDDGDGEAKFEEIDLKLIGTT